MTRSAKTWRQSFCGTPCTQGSRFGGSNLIQWVRLPLGFIPALTAWAHYGLLLGTNSFAIPLTARAAPSLSLVLHRAGPYELTAYVLVAAATAQWSRWRQVGWTSGPIEPLQPARLGHIEWGMLSVAAVLMLVGAWVETVGWLHQGQ